MRNRRAGQWTDGDVDADGVRLHFHRTGAGGLPALVLAHGLSDNALCWTRVAQALEGEFDIVMIDARNHGQSGTAIGDTESMAADVVAVIETLGLERPAVIGHSIGARTVAQLAVTRPDLVSRLVLDDPPWTDERQDRKPSHRRRDDIRNWLGSFASMTDADFEALARTQHGDWHHDEYPAWIESNKQVRVEAAEALNAPGWPDVVARIECPTLLLHADPDRGGLVTAETAQRIGHLNDRVTTCYIREAGHNIRRENFDAYVDTVGRFLREPVFHATDIADYREIPMLGTDSSSRNSSSRHAELGWHGIDRNAPEIVAQREYLEANNGLASVEILDPSEIERAVKIFRRDGFVLVRDALDTDQTDFLRTGVTEAVDDIVAVDAERAGNRGSHRYSFGGSSVTRSMLHRPEWQMLLDLPTVTPILTAIFESSDYMLRSASGDFCLPGAVGYQPLHSDMRDFTPEVPSQFSSFYDPRGFITTRDLPCPYLCVNFLPFEQTRLNGPTRQVPGTQHSRAPFPTLDEEPEWMRLSTVCPAPAGTVQIRDVRAWHGGTPNLSNELRAIPNLEFYAPWFREPIIPGITYADHKKLSEHAQRITRFSVIDSSEKLPSGYVVEPFPALPTARTDDD